MPLTLLRHLDLPRANDISRRNLYHLIVAYVLISLPMLTLFPVGILGVAVLTVGLKTLAVYKHWRLSKWWVFPIAVLSVVLVVMNATAIGLEYTSVVMLFIFASLKLLEAREERDAFVLMLINFLLIMGALMADDSPWVFVFLVVCFLYNIYIQLRIAQPVGMGFTLKQNIKMLLKMFLISLPFVVALFFFFPRLEPLWRQPAPPVAKTGLSDEMTPNSLSELTQDGGLAFRVKFEDTIPSQNQLYWRGPVLSFFDGKTWRRDKANLTVAIQPHVSKDSEINYTVYHDGTTGYWVLPLDLPGKLPPKTRMNTAYEMVNMEGGTKATALTLTSYLQYRLPDISRQERQINTWVPKKRFLQTEKLAEQLKSQSATDEAFVARVLDYFSDNPFYYDLAPPVGNSDLDTFLFKNRTGYCEHYASAFTFMMRSQGVPARIVTGYQGGELNLITGEMEVRQYNAHAWSEVYLDGKGWVRIDPTAAVAPSRVNLGSPFGVARNTQTIAFGARFEQQSDAFRFVTTRLRAMRAFWQNWVINYNNDKQNSLWAKLGLSDYKAVAWIGVFLLSLPIIPLVLWLRRRRKVKRQDDIIAKTMQPFIRYLAVNHLEKPSGAAWQTFIQDHARSLGESHKNALHVINHYYQLRYAQPHVERTPDVKPLKQAIQLFIEKHRLIKKRGS